MTAIQCQEDWQEHISSERADVHLCSALFFCFFDVQFFSMALTHQATLKRFGT